MKLKRHGAGNYVTADGRYLVFRTILNTHRCWIIQHPSGYAMGQWHEPKTYHTLAEARSVIENPLAHFGPRAPIKPQAPRVLLDYKIRRERMLSSSS